MAGLDNMKHQILDEAQTAADRKVQEANAQADEIIDQAKAEAAKISESIFQKSEAEVENYRERILSSIDLQKRTKILEAKQEMIGEVLDKSYESLAGMEPEAYFNMLLKLLGKYALPQEGEIFFSQADIKRMPSGYEAEIMKAAKAKGGSLKVSEEGRNIENGFVLAYGGIEENCTLRAMFDEKRDELSDKVRELLFA